MENKQPIIISVTKFNILANNMLTPNSITDRSSSSVQSVPQTKYEILLLKFIKIF